MASNKIKKKIDPEVLWLERLGFFDVIAAFVRKPFSDRTVYFGENGETRLARYALAFIERRKMHLKILPLSLSLENESARMETLVYKVNQDMHACAEDLFAAYMSGRTSRLKSVFRCYMAGALRSRVAFAVVVEYRSKPMIGTRHIIRFTRHPMNRVLCHLYRRRGFAVKEYMGMSAYIVSIGRLLNFLASVIRSKVLSAPPPSNIPEIKPSIWIEYDHESFIDLAFWEESAKRKCFDIIYYLDRKNATISPEITNSIEKEGALWIDTRLKSIASNLSTVQMIALIKEFIRSDDRPFWLRFFDFEYNFWSLIYAALFKKYKVKILIQHQDTSWKQGVQVAAMESAGGIMIGFHWSSYPARMGIDHFFPYHVFFVWGKLISDILQPYDSKCRHVLPSGVWIQKDDVELKELRDRLKTFKFAFTIFDSTVSYNIHQTPSSLSRFYLLLLELLEKNASWGTVIKNKMGELDKISELPGGRDIVRRFQLLIDAGRVFFLSSMTSPVTAAALTDISVCYGLNSAGIVAGTYGHRVLHWDCAGWLLHPFYKDRGQKIAYRVLEELGSAITAASNGDSSIGDFSKWRQSFNHFEDFNADSRVGRFIGKFMEDIVKTGDVDSSLDSAVWQYKETNMIDDSFPRVETT
ncbi:MAG: hypothetical protein PHN63_06045, partial [Candidatus Omnitrophica bacterium]|nr:hypothetical protein [Candidatus Omnitrophota bacterium]